MDDIAETAKIYNKILESDEARAMTGWQKGVYPSYQTALGAHDSGELFVMESMGEVVAAAIINQKQAPEYANCEWECDAPEEIMVLHTLLVDPEKSGKGYATDFVSFYEAYALENGCNHLRMDTSETNAAARKL